MPELVNGYAAICAMVAEEKRKKSSKPDPQKGLHFGGVIPTSSGNVLIKEVIYNRPATVVKWSDGTKTSSVCDEKDTYSPETGLAIAVLKKVIDPDEVVKTLKDWTPTTPQTKKMTLHDVRLKNKKQ